MKYISILFLLVSFNSQSQTITWSDLLPNLDPINDPFLKLTPDQLYLLSMLTRYNEFETLSETQVKNKNEISQKLINQGVEIEKLLGMKDKIQHERTKRALTANDSIIGKKSKIPGYIVPLELKGSLVTQFFLVPTAGSCIHTPPPPPNQIVLVNYPDGIEIPSLYTAFWVQGKLTSSKNTYDVNFSDGYANVQSIYKIDANMVEEY